jgi:hypothetical protein
MYVVQTKYIDRDPDWCRNAKKIDQVIQDAFQRHTFTVLVRDGRYGSDDDGGILRVRSRIGYIACAKDKATLLAGLRVCPLSAAISGDLANLAYVTGTYDHEKIGAWANSKVEGKKAWHELKSTELGQQLIGDGLTREAVQKSIDRSRLNQRGYYVVVTRGSTLSQNPRACKLHESVVTFGALAGHITTKISKEEAVSRLFDDLLAA